MKIVLIGTPGILTLLNNFKEPNVDFFMPNNIYSSNLLVGSNLILNNSFIQSRILGENKEILSYKTQELFPIYLYYYKVQSNFKRIDLVKRNFNFLLQNYDKILLSIPNNFIFRTKISGVYFYNTLKQDKKRKPQATFYSSFTNKIASFSNGELVSSYYLEPIKDSIKILFIKEAKIKEKIPDKIIILNLINNNDKIIKNYKEVIYG